MIIPITQTDLDCLDDEMFAIRRRHGREIEAVEDAHDLEHDRTLGRRRQFGDLDVSIRAAHGRVPPSGVRSKIVRDHEPAVAPEYVHDVLRDRALVVRVGSIGRQQLDEASQRFLAQHFADACTAVHGLPFRKGPVGTSESLRGCGQHRRDREAVPGVANGVGRQFPETHRAPPFEQLEPPGDGSRHGHRVRPHQQRRPGQRIAHAVERGRGRRTARAEIPVQFAVPDDGEDVPAVSAEVRRHDSERQVRANDRVDGVSAPGEHCGAGGRRQVVRRRERCVRIRGRVSGDHASSTTTESFEPTVRSSSTAPSWASVASSPSAMPPLTGSSINRLTNLMP